MWGVYIDWDNDADFADSIDSIWADVVSIKWRLGTGRAYQTVADESICEIEVRNTDGKYNPENVSSPLYGKLLPHRPVKITTGDTPLWRGWIERIEPDWQPAGAYTGQTLAVITCVGAKEMLQKASVDLPLQQHKRADEVIAEVLRRVVLPPAVNQGWLLGKDGYSELGVNTVLASESDYSDLETGELTFRYYGDIRGVSREEGSNGYRIIRDVTDAERGFFYFDRAGKAVFWNQNHLLDYAEAAGVVDTDGVLGIRPTRIRYAYGVSLANHVEVRCYQRLEGGTVTLWSLDKPITIAAGDLVKFDAPFTDDKRRRAGALSASAANIIFSSGMAAVSLIRSAERAQVTISNSGTENAELTSLDIVGQVLTAHNEMIVQRDDADSVRNYGERQDLKLNLKALDDYNEAVDIAEFELRRRKNPRGEVQQITLVNRADGTANLEQLTWTIGTRIRVVADEFGHDAAYLIVGEQHSLTAGGSVHETTYTLQPIPVNRLTYLSKQHLDTGLALANEHAYVRLTQAFEIQHDRAINLIRLRLRKVGLPTGDLTLKIYEDGSVDDPWQLGVTDHSELGTHTVLSPDGSNSFPNESGYTADQCSGGTASAESEFSGAVDAAKAFDNNNATSWVSAGVLPEWIEYNFGTGKTIKRYTIKSITDPATYKRAPRDFSLQYYDGADWQDADVRFDVRWTSTSQTQTFDVSAYASAARWRLYITDNDFTDDYVSIAEIEMMEETVVASSETVSAAGLETDFRWIDFTFSSPLSLSTDTRYWMMLETTNSADASNYVEWGAHEESYLRDLISAWRMEETSGTRSDAHGANHLAQNGGTLLSGAGKHDRAVLCSGSANLIIADNADLRVSGGQSFTFEFWVYIPVLDTTVNIAGKWLTGQEYLVYFDAPANRLRFIVKNAANNAYGIVSPNLAIDAGWHHVIAWHDGHNAELGMAVDLTEAALSWSQGIYAGSEIFGVYGIDDYRIDEMRFWKRALSSAERSGLYNGGAGLSYTDLNPYTLGEMKYHSSAAWKPAHADAVFEVYGE